MCVGCVVVFVFLVVLLLVIVDVRLVQELESSGCGVFAAEVPVAGMVGDGPVEPFDALEDECDGCADTFGSEELCHLFRQLFGCEGSIEPANGISVTSAPVCEFAAR